MSNSLLPSSLFKTISMYDDIEEHAAIAQSVAAAVIALPEYSKAPFTRGRAIGSRKVYRGVCSWFNDYLAPHPVYPPHRFRQIFRIPLTLYHILHDRLIEEEPDLNQRAEPFGIRGHTSHQKILMILRRLGTGLSFRQMDDMALMSVESQRQAFLVTLKAIHRRFEPTYLNRKPNDSELRGLVGYYEARGFPGCMGAVDCMHLHWKNFPLVYKGQYHNPKNVKLATISCEALCDSSLYCWNWLVGRCGTNNDLTVLRHSPLFLDIFNGERRMELPEGYRFNGIVRHWLLYMLADGIYPPWCIFVKPNSAPLNEKETTYTKMQESVRKDIERFFGILQGRFRILRLELHEWSDELIILVSQVCVILHNMIVEMCTRGELSSETSEAGEAVDVVTEFADEIMGVMGSDGDGGSTAEGTRTTDIGETIFGELLERSSVIMSEERHIQLQSELSNRFWNQRGDCG